MHSARIAMLRLRRAISRRSGEPPPPAAWVRAMRPNSVCAPVANTTARPCPDTTEVPASRMLRASSACSSADGAASQLRGRDSPVTVAG
jgi:hypothetical protein